MDNDDIDADAIGVHQTNFQYIILDCERFIIAVIYFVS